MIDQSLIQNLEATARAAGKVILDIRARGFDTRIKADNSPVTQADQAAETIILESLTQLMPGVPVIAEESFSARTQDPEGTFILVDPLDGTKEFVAGRDEFTVNIGIIESGVPIAGVIFAPALDSLFSAVAGKAWNVDGQARIPLGGRKSDLERLTAVTSRLHVGQATKALMKKLGVCHAVGIGSSLKFTLIAQGKADFYPRFGRTMEWDTAAGDAILRAAGGLVLNREGETLRYGKAETADPFANDGFFAFASEKVADAYLSHMNLR